MKKLYSILLITVLSFIPYINSLGNEFVWDDVDLVRDNPDVKSFKKFPELFLSPFGNPVQFKESPLFYRPLIFFSYMVDYKLWGTNPAGYHLSNIILHTLSSVFIFLILLKIFSDLKFSLFSSLIFAVHPVHTESVTWISGRTDVLCALLLLLSFNAYLNFLKSAGKGSSFNYFFSVIFFTLSIFSKEAAIVLPLIMLFYEIFFLSENTTVIASIKISIRKYFLFIFPVIFYFVLRTIALKNNFYPSLTRASLTERLLTAVTVFFDYIRLQFFPITLNSLYMVKTVSNIFDFKTVLSILTLFLIFALSTKSKKASGKLFFGTMWFFISLLPVSNIIPFSSIVKAEHFLYLPSIGFSIMAGAALSGINNILSDRSNRKKMISLLLTAIILIFFSVQTLKRNYVWKDEISLFEDQVLKSPLSYIAHNNLGLAYKVSGKPGLARNQFLYVQKINPKTQSSYVNLGNLYFVSGEMIPAIENYKKAIEINPAGFSVHNNLGVAYAKTGKLKEAVREFETASGLNPKYTSPHINLGNAYLNLREYDKAVIELKKAIEINPYLSSPYFLLGIIYKNNGETDLAAEVLNKAIKLDPKNKKAIIMLKDIYSEKGESDGKP
ncbi:MAG: hypothetical protein A2W05_06955 [Candidatus Schekmanbacteria bacterium RBG_16_38_10]|uniref:Uncharacterized protein n=1 Tax=Candidatus Schekmanbacteria bacterium RBG_16_38_10 TaxID=1817879 RepID=A0A1F7S0J6_9BACT|nr:MAG: hypothetical protein A2W05_06955 [Candidatus Schekmanbacteria bacterium RBG_16_38_10]